MNCKGSKLAVFCGRSILLVGKHMVFCEVEGMGNCPVKACQFRGAFPATCK